MRAVILWFVMEQCGIPPMPPIPPIGTDTCWPVCQCDEHGSNCHYIFECR